MKKQYSKRSKKSTGKKDQAVKETKYLDRHLIDVSKAISGNPVYIPIFVITLYLLPLIILGQDSYVPIHDNLDSVITWYKVLADNKMVLAAPGVPIGQFMNGLPRMALGSELNVFLWLFSFFRPFTAYTINEIAMHFLAFLGMYLLLKRHILKNGNNILIAGVSLAFALTWFCPLEGLSIAGQPLALNAFLNIRSKQSSVYDWVVLLLLPFYSSFVLAFVFFLCALSLLLVYDVFRAKSINLKFLFALIGMTSIYLVVEHSVFYNLLTNKYILSHRVEFNVAKLNLQTAVASLRVAIGDILFARLILMTVALTVFLAVLKKLRINKRFFLLLTSIMLISVFHGAWGWEGWLPIKEKVTVLNTFQFDRFYYLIPLLWYIVFALALSMILKNIRFGKYIVSSIIALQVCQLFFFTNPLPSQLILSITPQTLARNVGVISKLKLKYHPTYSEFYAQDLLGEVKKFIRKDPKDYRIVSIGLEPSVSQYNGFYTVDGYFVNYPVAYKHEFRRVIAKELSKNEETERYFDYWGSRCYIFPGELNRRTVISKNEGIKIHSLDLNTPALKKLGANYVLSAVEISNSRANSLELMRSFEDKGSYYRIYLYKVI